MQKTAYRYRQTERAVAERADVLGRTAALVGLSYLSSTLFAGFNNLAAWTGKAWRAAMTRILQGVSRLPLIGWMIGSYAAFYDGANQQHTEPFSKSVSGFFGRWSIKFSAEYYEAKEQDEHAKEPFLRAGRSDG